MKLSFTLPLLLILSFTHCGTGSFHKTLTAEAYSDDISQAEKLVKAGKNHEAINDLSAIIAMNKKNESALTLRGLAYQKMEKIDEAIIDYNAALKVNENNLKAHYNLGMIYAFKKDDPKKAMDHFDHFLTIDPENKLAYQAAKTMCTLDGNQESNSEGASGELLANAMGAKSNSEKREILVNASKKFPNNALFLLLIGQTFEAEQKNSDAMHYYEEALKIHPTCAPCHLALGELQNKTKNKKSAAIHLKKAELFDPLSGGKEPTP